MSVLWWILQGSPKGKGGSEYVIWGVWRGHFQKFSKKSKYQSRNSSISSLVTLTILFSPPPPAPISGTRYRKSRAQSSLSSHSLPEAYGQDHFGPQLPDELTGC